MNEILDEICAYLHNWFSKPGDIHRGEFTITDGKMDGVDFLQEGQYFRIKGSVFNDGVYCYELLTSSYDMHDETFFGEVWEMAVPSTVISIAEEIQAWNEKYSGVNSVINSPFTSESFNNYSYSKASGSSAGDSSGYAPITWKDIYGSRLSRWRKL